MVPEMNQYMDPEILKFEDFGVFDEIVSFAYVVLRKVPLNSFCILTRFIQELICRQEKNQNEE